MGEALRTVGLKKHYKMGLVVVEALRGIDMKVMQGEFISIVGPSGSGKSTLLNLLAALDRPTEGEVYVDGIAISRLRDDELAVLRNRKFGFVFQSFNLITRLTALENVELPAMVAGLGKEARRAKALEMLEAVGLGGKADRKPLELSGGEQQRVALARALINSPTILLADEPTGNLDSKTGMEIFRLMRRLNEEMGTTVIVVTHNQELAKGSDRVLLLKDGIIEREVLPHNRIV